MGLAQFGGISRRFDHFLMDVRIPHSHTHTDDTRWTLGTAQTHIHTGALEETPKMTDIRLYPDSHRHTLHSTSPSHQTIHRKTFFLILRAHTHTQYGGTRYISYLCRSQQ